MLIVPLARARASAAGRARAATPSGIGTTTQITARMSVCSRAPCSAGSWKTLPVAPVNQRNENPCQVVRERPLLNANAIAITTGRTDQTM